MCVSIDITFLEELVVAPANDCGNTELVLLPYTPPHMAKSQWNSTAHDW